MKSPCCAVCGTQRARGLSVGSVAGWPPSSSLPAAFLFICLLNGFGCSSHLQRCTQTVHEAPIVAVPRTELGWESQEAEVWLHLRHRAAPTALNPWQWRELLVPGPPQLPSLSSSIPPATSQMRPCLGRQFCPWQWWGFASPWHSCGKSGIHRTLPRAGLTSWRYRSITGCRNDLELSDCICLPPLAPAGPGSLQPEGSDGQHGARPGAVPPSTHHSLFHFFLHCQTDPC